MKPTSILFRGGMVGDLVFKLVDKNSTKNHYFDQRSKLKKFWNYSYKEKVEYYDNLLDGYVLTHDTDFCLNHPCNVVQIYCSSIEKIVYISKRFFSLHQQNVIKKVSKDINCEETSFIEAYRKDILNWQEYHNFTHKFDIKNIGTNNFLDDVVEYFPDVDIDRAEKIYAYWKSKEKFIPVY